MGDIVLGQVVLILVVLSEPILVERLITIHQETIQTLANLTKRQLIHVNVEHVREVENVGHVMEKEPIIKCLQVLKHVQAVVEEVLVEHVMVLVLMVLPIINLLSVRADL